MELLISVFFHLEAESPFLSLIFRYHLSLYLFQCSLSSRPDSHRLWITNTSSFVLSTPYTLGKDDSVYLSGVIYTSIGTSAYLNRSRTVLWSFGAFEGGSFGRRLEWEYPNSQLKGSFPPFPSFFSLKALNTYTLAG